MGNEQPEEKSKFLKWLLPWLLPLGATIVIAIIGFVFSIGGMKSNVTWIKEELKEKVKPDLKAIDGKVDDLDKKVDKAVWERDNILQKIEEIKKKLESLEKD